MGQICNWLKPAIPLVSNYTECKQSYLLRQNSSRVYIACLYCASAGSRLTAVSVIGIFAFWKIGVWKSFTFLIPFKFFFMVYKLYQ